MAVVKDGVVLPAFVQVVALVDCCHKYVKPAACVAPTKESVNETFGQGVALLIVPATGEPAHGVSGIILIK